MIVLLYFIIAISRISFHINIVKRSHRDARAVQEIAPVYDK